MRLLKIREAPCLFSTKLHRSRDFIMFKIILKNKYIIRKFYFFICVFFLLSPNFLNAQCGVCKVLKDISAAQSKTTLNNLQCLTSHLHYISLNLASNSIYCDRDKLTFRIHFISNGVSNPNRPTAKPLIYSVELLTKE